MSGPATVMADRSAPGQPSARPRTDPARGVPAVLVILGLAATALSTSWMPGPVGQPLLSLVTVGGIAAGALATLRAAGHSAHPRVWRWYAAASLTALAGACLVELLAGDGVPVNVGLIPGMLLALVPLALLIPPDTWRGIRGQLLSSLLMFVLGCLVALLSSFVLVLGTDLADVAGHAGMLYALAGTIALTTSGCLLVLASSSGRLRRVAVLVLAAQLLDAAASSLGGLLPILDPAAPAPQPVTGALGILGAGLLALAARSDHARAGTGRSTIATSSVAAILPTVTALLAGALLLATVARSGHIDPVRLTLTLIGLVLLVVHQILTWRDQRSLTSRLLRSEAYFRALVRSSVDPVVILDDRFQVAWASGAERELLGHDPAQVVGQQITAAVHPDDAPGLLAALRSAQPADAVEGLTRTARLRHRDGRWRLIQARIRDLREDPDVGALVLYCRDVTRETAPCPAAVIDAHSPLVATTDAVTGLPNRAALVQRLAHLLRDTSPPRALVKVGLAGLPADSSPAVLLDPSGRFSRVLRGDDWLVRSGPDAFAVLVTGSVADAETVAHRLTATVRPDTPIDGLRLSASAGVIALDGDGDAGEVLRHADVAMLSARDAGPGRVRRHSVALLIAQNRRASLRQDLSGALARGELRLVYQPVVDLALHRPVSVEALLRWEHPRWGPISPAEFVPLAEESALIVTLGRWVLHAATHTVAALPDIAVAVNVSARHVRSGELLADVLSALQASGLAASRLTVELTESVLLDDPHVNEELLALRRLGVRIAVDDFGTGWSSLAYLVGLPIDVLKMDRQFLAGVEGDPQRRALCRSVLHLGTSLGMDVIVEGVETPAELDLLRDMGHRFVQGFLLARPIEEPELPGRLADVVALPGGVPS